MPYPAQKAERSAKAPSGSHIGRVWSVAYDSHRVSGEDQRRVRVALQHEDASCIAIPPQNKTRRLSITWPPWASASGRGGKKLIDKNIKGGVRQRGQTVAVFDPQLCKSQFGIPP